MNEPQATYLSSGSGGFSHGSAKKKIRSLSNKKGGREEHRLNSTDAGRTRRLYKSNDEGNGTMENNPKNTDGFTNKSSSMGRKRAETSESEMHSSHSWRHSQNVPNRHSTILQGSYIYIPGYEGKAVYVDSKLSGKRVVSTYKPPNKANAISYFAIKFDQPIENSYQPGDEISGKVILDVQFPIAVRGVEFKITGFGSVTVSKEGFVNHRKKECYLTKKNRILGHGDNRATMINPGQYVSRFKYKLPSDIPASILSEDVVKTSMYKLDVSYVAQAIVYDDTVIKGNSIAKGRSGYIVVAKPIKVIASAFKVVNPKEIDTNPLPLSHTEYLNKKSKKDTPAIFLEVSNNVVHAGKEIQISIDCDKDYAKNVQEINLELVQTVTVPNSGFKNSKVVHELHHDVKRLEISKEIATWNILFLTPVTLVPTYAELPNLINIGYNLKVNICLPNKWMIMRMPLEIYRTVGLLNDTSSSVPVFRSVRRFPRLTNSLHKEGMGNGSAYKKNDVKVEVTYENEHGCKKGGALSCIS
ncbi:uncharacterized protein LOC141914793 [Tubulanus polymorphus]|uniref:uncharacterized protein LOC141914793 n=1 Tax=Tubulanus polymorphus TaxID=672921 RepID=UPI003DA62DF5